MTERSVNPSLAVWARTGKPVLIRQLLSKYPLEIDESLIWSVVGGDYAPTEHYLNCLEVLVGYGASVNIRDGIGKTPLHVCHTPEMAKLLITYGADIEAKDDYGLTPLGYFLRSGLSGVNSSYHILKVLLSHGADYASCGYTGFIYEDFAELIKTHSKGLV